MLVAAALSVTLGFVAAALAIGAWRWARATSALVARMEAEPAPAGTAGGTHFDPREVAGLPAPVARYFAAALTPGQPLVAAARIEWQGEFRTAEADDSWRPFEAVQTFRGRPSGFVWDARIRTAPGMTVRVRDAYVAGRGSMRAEILGLVPVAAVEGTPEVTQGALQRYLAEAVWFPTRLLPSQGVEWTPRDDSTAVAAITDHGVRATLEFRFDARGDVTAVFSPARPRAVGSRFEPTPWEGRFTAHAVHDGMRVPMAGSVEWHLPDRRLPYWRGRVQRIEWTFAP